LPLEKRVRASLKNLSHCRISCAADLPLIPREFAIAMLK
jgi:hypothetical protein